jgi:NAD(P)-dependent dehydrogenase (short-subunit alcohol dehydrogenase family)
VTHPQQAEATVKSAIDPLRRIDVLVNNAEVGPNRPLLQTNPEEWDRTVLHS